MKVQRLGEYEERRHRATHRVILTHADLTEATANTAQTIALLTVTAGTVLHSCFTRLVTAFADASDAAFNATAITIGDGGDVDRAITSQELNVNGTEVLFKANANTLPYAYLAGDTIDIVVGSMSAKSLVDIDTGELQIYLAVSDLTDIQL